MVASKFVEDKYAAGRHAKNSLIWVSSSKRYSAGLSDGWYSKTKDYCDEADEAERGATT